MALLCVLSPPGYLQVHHNCGIGLIYKFVERSAVPQVDLDIDFLADIFGTSYEADALQNNRPKNDFPLSIQFPTSYASKIRRYCRDEKFPVLDRP